MLQDRLVPAHFCVEDVEQVNRAAVLDVAQHVVVDI
jgi:hypothetical protein